MHIYVDGHRVYRYPSSMFKNTQQICRFTWFIGLSLGAREDVMDTAQLVTGSPQEYKCTLLILRYQHQRYQKARKTAQNFVVTQFGLTTWRISDRQYASTFVWHICKILKRYLFRYISETWNFYLFSHPFGKVDKRFVCQSSSIQYLAQHNFDFNKVFSMQATTT